MNINEKLFRSKEDIFDFRLKSKKTYTYELARTSYKFISGYRDRYESFVTLRSREMGRCKWWPRLAYRG